MTRRLVLAEDDDDMRDLLTAMLRQDGFEVVTVPDGGRLLVLLAHCARGEQPLPDVIVSDIRMPVMTGLAMLQGIRDARWRVPTVLVSGFADGPTRAHAASLGALLLSKPFGIDELRVAINEVLASAEATESGTFSRVLDGAHFAAGGTRPYRSIFR